jgi:antitoxin component of MazEF toxin-antitoxin module
VRALQRLIHNGNSTSITIPRTILHHLGWLCGEHVIIEVLEDRSLRIRRPCERDFAPLGPPHLLHDAPSSGAKT